MVEKRLTESDTPAYFLDTDAEPGVVGGNALFDVFQAGFVPVDGAAGIEVFEGAGPLPIRPQGTSRGVGIFDRGTALDASEALAVRRRYGVEACFQGWSL